MRSHGKFWMFRVWTLVVNSGFLGVEVSLSCFVFGYVL